MKPDFSITVLGNAAVRSPISLSKEKDDFRANYVDDDRFLLYDIETTAGAGPRDLPASQLLEQAGPREMIYFDPSKVRAGIVTCGGLCPGLNDVIRAVVMSLWYRYNVRGIFGF